MKPHALDFLIRQILRFKTKAEATAYVGNAGADYSELLWQLLDRLTWKRTLSQNALLHMWFGEIAKQTGQSALDVKGECHHKYGLVIRKRHPKFAWVWQRTGALLPYEKQCALLSSEKSGKDNDDAVFRISSAMSVSELSEYMDAMERDYRAQGIRLTVPVKEEA